jgi:uncharacterized protein YdeI (YjbR/CyaY-like superfamily)
MKTLDVRTRNAWRRWLAKNHAKQTEIWLVFHKKHTGIDCVPYEDSVEEALCFGWVDSLIKQLDADRYARKYTPRKATSVWSESNKARADKMIRAGLMTDVGLALIEAAKSSGEWQQKRTRSTFAGNEMPPELRAALAKNTKAAKNFLALPPSHKRNYLLWISAAKRTETRHRRAQQAAEMLRRGERLTISKPSP